MNIAESMSGIENKDFIGIYEGGTGAVIEVIKAITGIFFEIVFLIVNGLFGVILDLMHNIAVNLISKIHITFAIDDTFFTSPKTQYGNIILAFRNSMVTIALAVMLLIVVWQIFKSFFAYTGAEVDDTVKLAIRVMIFTILIFYSQDIIKYIITVIYKPIGDTIYSIIYDLKGLGIKEGANVGYMLNLILKNIGNTLLIDNAMAMKLGSFTLLIRGVVLVYLDYNILILMAKFAEKSIVLLLLIIIAPIAFACGVSRNTKFIFEGWLKSFTGVLTIYAIYNIILSMVVVFLYLQANGIIVIGGIKYSFIGEKNFIFSVGILLGLFALMDQGETIARGLGFNTGGISISANSGMDMIQEGVGNIQQGWKFAKTVGRTVSFGARYSGLAWTAKKVNGLVVSGIDNYNYRNENKNIRKILKGAKNGMSPEEYKKFKKELKEKRDKDRYDAKKLAFDKLKEKNKHLNDKQKDAISSQWAKLKGENGEKLKLKEKLKGTWTIAKNVGIMGYHIKDKVINNRKLKMEGNMLKVAGRKSDIELKNQIKEVKGELDRLKGLDDSKNAEDIKKAQDKLDSLNKRLQSGKLGRMKQDILGDRKLSEKGKKFIKSIKDFGSLNALDKVAAVGKMGAKAGKWFVVKNTSFGVLGIILDTALKVEGIDTNFTSIGMKASRNINNSAKRYTAKGMEYTVKGMENAVKGIKNIPKAIKSVPKGIKNLGKMKTYKNAAEITKKQLNKAAEITKKQLNNVAESTAKMARKPFSALKEQYEGDKEKWKRNYDIVKNLSGLGSENKFVTNYEVQLIKLNELQEKLPPMGNRTMEQYEASLSKEEKKTFNSFVSQAQKMDFNIKKATEALDKYKDDRKEVKNKIEKLKEDLKNQTGEEAKKTVKELEKEEKKLNALRKKIKEFDKIKPEIEKAKDRTNMKETDAVQQSKEENKQLYQEIKDAKSKKEDAQRRLEKIRREEKKDDGTNIEQSEARERIKKELEEHIENLDRKITENEERRKLNKERISAASATVNKEKYDKGQELNSRKDSNKVVQQYDAALREANQRSKKLEEKKELNKCKIEGYSKTIKENEAKMSQTSDAKQVEKLKKENDKIQEKITKKQDEISKIDKKIDAEKPIINKLNKERSENKIKEIDKELNSGNVTAERRKELEAKRAKHEKRIADIDSGSKSTKATSDNIQKSNRIESVGGTAQATSGTAPQSASTAKVPGATKATIGATSQSTSTEKSQGTSGSATQTISTEKASTTKEAAPKLDKKIQKLEKQYNESMKKATDDVKEFNKQEQKLKADDKNKEMSYKERMKVEEKKDAAESRVKDYEKMHGGIIKEQEKVKEEANKELSKQGITDKQEKKLQEKAKEAQEVIDALGGSKKEASSTKATTNLKDLEKQHNMDRKNQESTKAGTEAAKQGDKAETKVAVSVQADNKAKVAETAQQGDKAESKVASTAQAKATVESKQAETSEKASSKLKELEKQHKEDSKKQESTKATTEAKATGTAQTAQAKATAEAKQGDKAETRAVGTAQADTKAKATAEAKQGDKAETKVAVSVQADNKAKVAETAKQGDKAESKVASTAQAKATVESKQAETSEKASSKLKELEKQHKEDSKKQESTKATTEAKATGTAQTAQAKATAEAKQGDKAETRAVGTAQADTKAKATAEAKQGDKAETRVAGTAQTAQAKATTETRQGDKAETRAVGTAQADTKAKATAEAKQGDKAETRVAGTAQTAQAKATTETRQGDKAETRAVGTAQADTKAKATAEAKQGDKAETRAVGTAQADTKAKATAEAKQGDKAETRTAGTTKVTKAEETTAEARGTRTEGQARVQADNRRKGKQEEENIETVEAAEVEVLSEIEKRAKENEERQRIKDEEYRRQEEARKEQLRKDLKEYRELQESIRKKREEAERRAKNARILERTMEEMMEDKKLMEEIESLENEYNNLLHGNLEIQEKAQELNNLEQKEEKVIQKVDENIDNPNIDEDYNTKDNQDIANSEENDHENEEPNTK